MSLIAASTCFTINAHARFLSVLNLLRSMALSFRSSFQTSFPASPGNMGFLIIAGSSSTARSSSSSACPPRTSSKSSRSANPRFLRPPRFLPRPAPLPPSLGSARRAAGILLLCSGPGTSNGGTSNSGSTPLLIQSHGPGYARR